HGASELPERPSARCRPTHLLQLFVLLGLRLDPAALERRRRPPMRLVSLVVSPCGPRRVEAPAACVPIRLPESPAPSRGFEQVTRRTGATTDSPGRRPGSDRARNELRKDEVRRLLRSVRGHEPGLPARQVSAVP